MQVKFCAQVKQQRLERERERQLRDEEIEMMQREKEAEHFKVRISQLMRKSGLKQLDAPLLIVQ